MIPKPLQAFIAQLLKATEKGQLSWSEGDHGAYFCDHKNHTLHISYHFDPDEETSTYYFRIVTDGKVTPFSVRHFEDDFELMRNLYEAVIANANDVGDDVADFFN